MLTSMLLAAAVVANGDFHIGGGVGWSVPLNDSIAEQRQLTAVSVDLTWEWQHAFAGLTLVNAPFLHVNPEPDELKAGTPWAAGVVHAAYMPWTTPLASFFIGGGAGVMFTGFRLLDDETHTTLFHWDSGAALMGEAGFLLFRGARWGRISAAGQFFFPLFSVRPEFAGPGQTGAQKAPIFVLGLKAQL